MLIQALCEYYDKLSAKGLVERDGYSQVDVSYLVSLKPDGTVDDIIDWRDKEIREENGKIKEEYIRKIVVLPKRTEKSGIDCNYIEHRPLYIFGLSYDSDNKCLTTAYAKNRAEKSHAEFVKKTPEMFADVGSPIAQAYYNFAKNWNPEAETDNPFLLNLGKQLNSGYFAFCLSGRPDILLHEDPMTLAKWDTMNANAGEADEPETVCAITGERLPVARIHDKIMGVKGGQSSGTRLVSFKNASEHSYGKEQSYNSNVSVLAMRKYTGALNYLLKDKRHKTEVGEMTVLHWANSADDSCDDLFDMLFLSDTIDSEHMDEILQKVSSDLRQGMITVNLGDVETQIDPSVTYYIAGIKPNSSRLSVKFIYRQKFGTFLQNIIQHQNDLKVSEHGKPIPLWRIREELINPNSNTDEVAPSTMTKLLEAAVTGRPYPDFLLNTTVRRVKTDSDKTDSDKPEDKNIKINYTRMAILKACINRNDRVSGKKEEITMALDKNNTNPAYLCGRLFAVLEKTQQAASNNKLNRTIKDAYFSSAASKPATVFPRLLTLAQHHLAKLEKPYFLNKEIGDILCQLDQRFPDTLSLKDQGVFILGYYQQSNS